MLVAAILAQSVAAQIMAAPADISPEARITIAPVAAAIAEARAKQAALPPAKDDAEKLVRMGELEQAARAGLGKIDPTRIPAAERNKAMTAAWQQILAVDLANQKALLEMVPSEGWFTPAKYGPEASRAAFLIVQHSNADLWRRFLPVIEPLVAKGEIKGSEYALMYDRLANSEGRKQRYGSQMTCQGGKWTPLPIEDPDGLDARRATLGMPRYAEYLKNFTGGPPCG